MIDLLIVGGLAALVSYSKNRTPKGQMELLKRDYESGKLSPQNIQKRLNAIAKISDNEPFDDSFPLPENIRKHFENGGGYEELAKTVDPNTYNFLHAAYWNGDWDRTKRKRIS